MKQSYTEEELNILLSALDNAVATTIDVRKKYAKYIKMSVVQGAISILTILGICYGILSFMDYSTSSCFISIGVSFLVLIILEQIPFRSKIAVIDAINEYRGVFHRLEKDLPGIEPPVQLWSDRIIERRFRHGIVYENQYEKIYIPKDLNKRTVLAEQKLLEMKDQFFYKIK